MGRPEAEAEPGVGEACDDENGPRRRPRPPSPPPPRGSWTWTLLLFVLVCVLVIEKLLLVGLGVSRSVALATLATLGLGRPDWPSLRLDCCHVISEGEARCLARFNVRLRLRRGARRGSFRRGRVH